jgi:hypothetical protein
MSAMKLGWVARGVLLASVTAFSVAALPGPALAGPKHCPPGLAKKGSCIPPGHRKHWNVGEEIPHTVVYRRVYYTEYNLPPPRQGSFYANIGGDVYLLAQATMKVIEAINLIDAAAQ